MKHSPSLTDIEHFLTNHLPNHDISTFNAVVAALKKENVLISARQEVQKSSNPGYEFISLRSLLKTHSPSPTQVIDCLRTICEVVNNALESLGIRVDGDDRLSIHTDNETDLCLNACLTKKSEGPLSAFDVVVPISIVPLAENKTVGRHVMERIATTMNDDTREFSHTGHDQMTLHQATRTRVIHSHPFSLTGSADVLLRLFISLLTATDEQLGMDPFVTLLPEGSFLYKLPPEGEWTTPRFYETLDLISYYPSTTLGGRHARIWKVKEVISPSDLRRVAGTPDRVLKDVWVNAGTRTEADVQDALFRDISAITKARGWRKRPIFQDFLESDVDSLAEALQGDNFKRYFSCIVARHVRQPAPDLAPSDKHRCFFVYESVCTPLHEVSTFGEVIDILKQCVTALRLMFCAGWVHRDISTGNILAFKTSSSWQVKLSDLEYAKRFPDTDRAGREEIVGTPYFMPCEMHMGEHMFPLVLVNGKLKKHPNKPLVYGYQHDLEGIWWIILWFATTRIDQDLCREFGDLHFRQPIDRGCISRRWTLLTSRRGLEANPSLVDALPSELIDSGFLQILGLLRYQIHGEYMMRNAEGKQEDIGTYSFIISPSFTHFFEQLDESRAMWEDLKLSTTTELRHQHEREVVRQVYRRRPKRKVDEDTGIERKGMDGRGRKDEQGPPTKRARFTAPVAEVQAPVRRSGPVTRAMTRAAQNTGPTTRAAARRMREAAA